MKHAVDRRAFLKGAVAGAAAAAVGPSMGCMSVPVPPSDNISTASLPKMEGYIGQVALWPSDTRLPDGWVACDGRSVPVGQYLGLFAQIGNRFGGDGETEYALPRLNPPLPHTTYIISHNGFIPTPSLGGLHTPGRVTLNAIDFLPGGNLPCTGVLVRRSDYPELADALGVDPSATDFTLPNIPAPADGLAFVIQHVPDTYQLAPVIAELAWRPIANEPDGWLPSDGRLLSIEDTDADVAALATVLQNQFGGHIDIWGNQRLPDLPAIDGIPTLIRVKNG